jgi:hypothetical protein
VLLTRTPLYSPDCSGFLVRLACVRRAASVDSEPGSNSRLISLSQSPFRLNFQFQRISTVRPTRLSKIFAAHRVSVWKPGRPQASKAVLSANRRFCRCKSRQPHAQEFLGTLKNFRKSTGGYRPPNLLPLFYCVTVYEFYHFRSLARKCPAKSILALPREPEAK